MSEDNKIMSLADKSINFVCMVHLLSLNVKNFAAECIDFFFVVLFYRFKWCYREHLGLCGWEFLS